MVNKNFSRQIHQHKIIALLFLITICAMVFSLMFGSSGVLLHRLWTGDPAAVTIFLHVRLPRLCGCVLAGGALALSGAVIQSVLHNPLASPGIIGINAGSGFLTALGCALFPASFSIRPIAGFLGAMMAAGLILFLSVKMRASRTTVILCGVGISQIFSAGIDMVVTLAPDALSSYSSFRIGSLSGISLNALPIPAIGIGVLVLILFLCTNQLDVLSAGMDQAKAVGLNASFWMVFLLLLASGLAAFAVSLCGMLGFLGLIVPAVLRRILQGNSRLYLVGCLLCGITLLCLCDLLGRVIFAPYELPAGILMALIGAPLFLYLLFHKGAKRA